MIRFALGITLLFLISFMAEAQEKSAPPTSKGDEMKRFEFAKNYEANTKAKKKRRKKSSINSYYDQKIVEFEERMKKNARRINKRQKRMKKPKYSDPTYFGHKRPPKKRPPGKKKFCKVCELVH